MLPLEPAAAGWCKLVGFIPADAVEAVAAAVFATGAGGIGNYKDCAFAAEGTAGSRLGLEATPRWDRWHVRSGHPRCAGKR